jgi:hypothetical protein
MAMRNFELRINCTYIGSENKVEALHVEVREKGEWRALELDVTSPGFLIFAFAIFTCQHMYMRTNAAERNLALRQSQGTARIVADRDWRLQEIFVHFRAETRSGSPQQDDIDYIIRRMQACPVSINLKEGPEIRTQLEFNAEN